MTFITSADRRIDSDASASSAGKARRAARALVAVARSCLQGTPDLHLDDRLLHDIGLTRADYEALRR